MSLTLRLKISLALKKLLRPRFFQAMDLENPHCVERTPFCNVATFPRLPVFRDEPSFSELRLDLATELFCELNQELFLA